VEPLTPSENADLWSMAHRNYIQDMIPGHTHTHLHPPPLVREQRTYPLDLGPLNSGLLSQKPCMPGKTRPQRSPSETTLDRALISLLGVVSTTSTKSNLRKGVCVGHELHFTR
jgi:hypothetical protein